MEQLPRILIADDDPFARIVLENWLKESGYEVVSSVDGEDCLEKLADGGIDVVLTDLNMPGIDGIEVTSRIKQSADTEDLPVLLLTAEDSDEVLMKAFEAGATDYLRKPATRIELLARVSAAVRLRRETERRKAHEHELERNLRTLRDDLAAAGRLQRSALPKSTQLLAGLEVSWYFRPSEEVGGDILNYFPLNDSQVAAYLLDVSGHGVSSAMHAMSINSTLLRNNTPGGLLVDVNGRANPPGDVVDSLNEMFPMSEETSKYFTFVYLVIDLAEQTVSYTLAGHPPLLELSQGQVTRWEEGDLPVGMIPGMRFETHTRPLSVGSRLYLYSDGITEAENTAGEMFGLGRLQDTLSGKAEVLLASSVTDAIGELERWVDGRAYQDDVSLLAIELVKDIRTTRITVDATLENVRALCESVRKVVLIVNGDEMAAMWVDLVVAEAATNIAKHAYPSGVNGSMTMEVSATTSEIVVTLIDGGTPHDQTAELRTLDEWDQSIASEDGAGLGKSIMHQLADSIEYERTDNRNKLTIRRSLPIETLIE